MTKIVTLAALALTAFGSGATTVLINLPSGVKFEIVEASFKGSGISVKGCTPKALVCLVGGKPYGMATGLPETYIKSITASYAGSRFRLDCSGMYDAMVKLHSEQKMRRYFGGWCQEGNYCEFRAVLADGANTFAVEWVVVDGIPRSPFVTGDSDIIDLFLKNIDPPEYEQ